MASKLKQLEKQYMECMMVAMDKSSRFSVLDSDISTKGFGQMYFMLKASLKKEEKDDQGSFRSPGGRTFQEKDERPKDLLDVLQNNPRVIISGEPGAGKTTSLVYLTVLLTANYAMKTRISIEKAEPEPVMTILDKYPFGDLYIPIFIKLSEIKEQQLANINRFNDLIVQQVGQVFSNEDSNDLVEMWQKENRLWVILDGLDEMPGKAREDLLDKLRVFLKVNTEKNRMTLSSRPTGTPYERIMQKEKEGESTKLLHLFSLCPLDGDEASKGFSSAWLRKLGEPEYEKQADTLIEGIYKKGTINLARNPMLLRMMIHVYQTNGCDAEQLPPSRVKLYDKYIHDVILGNGDLQKFQINTNGNSKRFDPLMHILEYIAWFIHREDKALQKDDLIEELENYFPEGVAEEDWFDIFSNKMRLLYSNASGEYEFTHRSYQEYFLARRLFALYKENVLGKQWVLKKVISHCAYSDYYREVILMFLKELSLDFNEKKRYWGIKKLYDRNLKYSVIELEDLFYERILDPEVALTVEKNNNIKIEAIKALGKAKDHLSVDSLLIALRDEDRVVRAYVARTLGEIGDNHAVEALITALRDEDRSVRENAARALGKIGDNRAVEALIPALRDENRSVRENAARTLGEIGGNRAVEALITALRDENDFVRETAAGALERIGGHCAVEALITALRDVDGSVRANAARALGKVGDHHAVEALIIALRDEDRSVRANAARALGKIGGDRAVEALIPALRDEDGFVRYHAAGALVQIGDYRTVEVLITALRDENEYVRDNAARALGEIGGDHAIEALITALRDENDFVRETAAGALERIGDLRAVESLITALQDEDRSVRRTAAGALGKIGDHRAVEALITALRDENDFVRDYAARALGELGGDRAVEALITALRDENEDVCATAAGALGKIGDQRAVEALITALQVEDRSVRRTAAGALGRIGDHCAVEALIIALHDEDRSVRTYAARALGELGIPLAMIEDIEINPKNIKLQKKVKDILSKKNTLPKLPDPKVPRLDLLAIIKKSPLLTVVIIFTALLLIAIIDAMIWLIKTRIDPDYVAKWIGSPTQYVEAHPVQSFLGLIGLLFIGSLISKFFFEKLKK